MLGRVLKPKISFIRVCFPDEICPGECDHGVPSADWLAPIGHDPLALSVRSGPFFFANSAALEFKTAVEVETILTPTEEELLARSEAEIFKDISQKPPQVRVFVY